MSLEANGRTDAHIQRAGASLAVAPSEERSGSRVVEVDDTDQAGPSMRNHSEREPDGL
jgi:hypothetical protein